MFHYNRDHSQWSGANANGGMIQQFQQRGRFQKFGSGSRSWACRRRSGTCSRSIRSKRTSGKHRITHLHTFHRLSIRPCVHAQSEWRKTDSAPIGCLASVPLWSVSAGSGRLHFICSFLSKFYFYLKTLWTFGLMALSECPLWRK